MPKLRIQFKYVGTSVLALLILTQASLVLAVPLSPGSAVSLSGPAGGVGPGTVVFERFTDFTVFDYTGTITLFKGTLHNRVVELDSTGTLSIEH